MKYVCIVSSGGIGGVWSVVKESLLVFKKHYDVKLVVLLMKGKLQHELLDFIKEEQIDHLIVNIPWRNGWLFDIGKAASVSKIKKFIGPSDRAIIHSHDGFASGCYLSAMKMENYNLFCTFHGTFFNDRHLKARIRDYVNKQIRGRLLTYSQAHLISCDPCSVETLKGCFPDEKEFSVAVNGVRAFDLSTKIDDSGVFTIGYISRFHPLKGWNILARACELIWQRGVRNIRVLFAGAGPCAGEAEEWCKNHSEYCTFLGQVQDVRKSVLPILDLHVLPTSYPEGLPMAILETMSAGIPSITTDAGSNTVAVEDGVNGFIVVPEVEEVASKIMLLISNPTLFASMRESNLTKWRAHFSAESMVSQYMRIFERHMR